MSTIFLRVLKIIEINDQNFPKIEGKGTHCFLPE